MSNDEIDRRHMTDAQKVKVGQDIEPDVAAVAKARSVSNLKNQSSGTGVPLEKSISRTRAEVARSVGIGSGRTYERASIPAFLHLHPRRYGEAGYGQAR